MMNGAEERRWFSYWHWLTIAAPAKALFPLWAKVIAGTSHWETGAKIGRYEKYRGKTATKTLCDRIGTVLC